MDLKKYLDSLGPATMVEPKLAKVSDELLILEVDIVCMFNRVTCIRFYKE